MSAHPDRVLEQRDDFERAYRAEYERAWRLKDLLTRAKAELPITPAGRALRAEIEALISPAKASFTHHQSMPKETRK